MDDPLSRGAILQNPARIVQAQDLVIRNARIIEAPGKPGAGKPVTAS